MDPLRLDDQVCFALHAASRAMTAAYQPLLAALVTWRLSTWKKAHANAVENLGVFATLVLAANALGITGGVVATAAIVYFWSRVVHAVAYTAAWPWVRRRVPAASANA